MGWATAAATVLVVAAVALLGFALFGLHGQGGRLGPQAVSGAADPSASLTTHGVAPAPPQSYSRPADESRPFVPASEPRLLEAPEEE